MATLVLRAGKGSPLTNAEVDANFTNLNNELLTKQFVLVSGTSIKTVNGQSVLGSGNIQIDGGVTSFNTRTGAVTLGSSDVTTALGFTPFSNSGGAISGYATVRSSLSLGASSVNPGQIGFNRNVETNAIINASYGAYQLQNTAGTLALQYFNSVGGYVGQHTFGIDGVSTFGGNVRVNAGADSRVLVQNSGTTVAQLQATASEARLHGVGAIPVSLWSDGVKILEASTSQVTINNRPLVSTNTVTASSFIGSGASLTGLTSGQITGALGFTPYNSTNPSGYITSSALSSYLPLSGGALSGVLTINSTSDNQLLLQSTDSWTGIGFNDSAPLATDYIWHNGTNGTFALGGGGANVAGKKLHVHGGMTVGANYATTTNPTNGLNVEGAIQQAGNQVLHAGNYTSYALPLSGGTLSGNLNFTNLYFSANNSYGIEGANGYFDTVNSGSNNDPLELVYVRGSGVKIGTGTNGSKPLYAVGIYDNGNQVLHAGNYSSYALPLSGGTVTGVLIGNGGFANVDGGIRIANPGGASYATTAGTVTGAIKIRLPAAALGSNTMLSFRVRVYQYSGGLTQEFVIAGYNYGDASATWYNVSALSLSDTGSDFTVRFGKDGTSQCVYIGELGSTWSYPQVHVVDFCGGYSGMAASTWATGWNISFESSAFAGVTNSRTAWRSLNAANYSSFALPLSGGTLTGGLTVARKRLSFSSSYDDANHSIYNNYTNIDGEGGWDGMKMNVYDGLRIRVGNASGTPPTTVFALNPGNVRINTQLQVGQNTNGTAIIDAFGGIARFGRDSTSYGLELDGNNYATLRNANGYLQIGPLNTSHSHFQTDRGSFYFNRDVYVDGQLYRYSGSQPYLHSGNYTSYALPLSGGTVSGPVDINSGGDYTLELSSSQRYQLRIRNTAASAQAAGWWLAHDAGGKLIFHADSSGDKVAISSAGVVEANNYLLNGNQVLHAGNYSSYAVPQSDVSTSGGGNVVLKTQSSGYLYVNNWINTGGGGLFSGTNSAHWYPNDGTYGAWKMSGSRNGWGGIAFGSLSNGEVSLMIATDSNTVGFHNASYGWQIRWANGTGFIGKNSYGGNEATILDTSNYSSYVLPLSGGTVTGVAYFQTNNGGRSGDTNTAKLQAYSTGNNSAFMSFHKGGHYAINMGLDDDNVFRIGGWSAAANRFQMDMSGNLTMAGNVTAYSDESLKKDWAPVATDFIARLANVKHGTYTRIDSGERQAGASAQDWQKLLPEVVNAGADGILSLAYGNAAVVSAIELAKKVIEQDERIKRLEALVEKLIGA